MSIETGSKTAFSLFNLMYLNVLEFVLRVAYKNSRRQTCTVSDEKNNHPIIKFGQISVPVCPGRTDSVRPVLYVIDTDVTRKNSIKEFEILL